jgi:regulator of sigma D
MAKKINALEQKRLAHINHLMAEVHAATNNVYESFVDKEYELAKKHTQSLIRRLRDVIQSLEDEI